MNRHLTYLISEKDAGTEVLAFLRQKGFSRHILHSMKQDRTNLLLNGQPGSGRAVLSSGDELTITVPETENCSAVPRELPFEVLYEDEDLLAVNKPANMPVHPSIGNYENTLSNAVAWYSTTRGESYPIRCINRLDRDTTGVLLIAKNPLSGAILSTQIRERKIHRTYLALVEGCTDPSGTINAPIARMADSVILRHVDPENGERAVTHYERLECKNGLSLLKVWLETGRTHQIRVHMKYIGHPLPGDYLYNPVYERIDRQPLHSASLTFTHPITGVAMEVTAPVPQDMRTAFE